MREEKAKTEENRLVVTTANMLLLESNVRFLLLRWLAFLRWHTVTETIIQRAKETHVRPTKERTSIEQVFRDVFLASLFLVGSLFRFITTTRVGIIVMHILIRSEFWWRGRIERQFDREQSWLVFIIFLHFLILTLVWWNNSEQEYLIKKKLMYYVFNILFIYVPMDINWYLKIRRL
jgi:hypothetical protein